MVLWVEGSPGLPPLSRRYAAGRRVGGGRCGGDGESDERANRRLRYDFHLDCDGFAWTEGKIFSAARPCTAELLGIDHRCAGGRRQFLTRWHHPPSVAASDRMGGAEQGCIAGFLASRRYLDSARGQRLHPTASAGL